jgi:uncharacterized protein (DUF433 family)
MVIDTKRQNFNITPEQEADLLALQREMDAPSVKDAILRAVRLALLVSREVRRGSRLYLADAHGSMTAVMWPDFEAGAASSWTYLVARPHAWKKQFFIKGRRLTAAQVWLDMQSNHMSREEAADNWDLPIEAIDEVIRYCEQNRALLQMEAAEERLYLEAKEVTLRSSDDQALGVSGV